MPGKDHEAWFSQELYERNYQAALDRLDSISSEILQRQDLFTPKVPLAADVYRFMGKPERASTSYDSARVLLEAEGKKRPEDHRVHSSLGIAYAGLGRKDEAMREGKWGIELFPVSKGAIIGPERVEDLAIIYVMVGEYDLAIDQLELLLSIPSSLSTNLVQLHPLWDPLRDHPRFQALLERYDTDS